MRNMVLSALLIGSVSGGAALAGDGNFVDLLQISTGQIGNTLSIDQSDANNATLSGDRLSLTPARQVGDANTAALTIGGNGGQIGFAQTGIANDATVSILGPNALGLIAQTGTGNAANLFVTSLDGASPAEGVINQLGNNNTGTLTVNGVNTSGRLVQIGSGNTNALDVSGADASVVFTQIGNGLTNPGGDGVSVFTNGSVSITQTNFGTLN